MENMVFGIPLDLDDFHLAFQTIEKIREDLLGGVVAMVGLYENSLRSNLRSANSYGADLVLIFDKKRFGDKIAIKDMVKHTQVVVDKHEVFDKVKELLGISYPKELLMNYKAEELSLDTVETLLELYYKKGYK